MYGPYLLFFGYHARNAEKVVASRCPSLLSSWYLRRCFDFGFISIPSDLTSDPFTIAQRRKDPHVKQTILISFFYSLVSMARRSQASAGLVETKGKKNSGALRRRGGRVIASRLSLIFTTGPDLPFFLPHRITACLRWYQLSVSSLAPTGADTCSCMS